VTPFSLGLYRLVTRLAEPLAKPLLQRRTRRGKEDPVRLDERLGYASAPRPEGPLLWLHGASVGESLSLLPLISGFASRRPEVALLVTSGTLTSAELLKDRLPASVRHQFAPIDAPLAVRRFLKHWRPEAGVFVESEIWPNLILGARNQGVRLALLSARVSEDSLRNWRRAPAAARALLEAFDIIMPQDSESARRLESLGAQTEDLLNLKRLTQAPAPHPEGLAVLKRALHGRRLILAASTHAGEDELILEAFSGLRKSVGDLHLVIAPRHPGRGVDIAATARSAGFTVALRSAGKAPATSEVYVADTLGELGLWFCLAEAAFIGGSLVQGPGGHNPVEPAQLNCPIVAGPHLQNWRSLYDELASAQGVKIVKDAQDLAEAFHQLLCFPYEAAAQAERAKNATMPPDASLEQALERLEDLLP